MTYCADSTGFVTSSASRVDTTATSSVASRARSERQIAAEPRKSVPARTGSCSRRSAPGAAVAASPTRLKENDPNATCVALMPNAARSAMTEPTTDSIWSGRLAVNARSSSGVAPGETRYAPNETRPTMATANRNLASGDLPPVRQAYTANKGMRKTAKTFSPAASPRAMPGATQCRAVAPQIAPRTSTAGRMSYRQTTRAALASTRAAYRRVCREVGSDASPARAMAYAPTAAAAAISTASANA